jgi:hypothetical protein
MAWGAASPMISSATRAISFSSSMRSLVGGAFVARS